MAYIEPSEIGNGLIVPHTKWNQDVVDNILELKSLVDKRQPSLIVEPNVNYQFTAASWTPRRMSQVEDDFNNIIISHDDTNYWWDLADGDYIVEINTFGIVGSEGKTLVSRLRDLDNSVNVVSTAGEIGYTGLFGMSSVFYCVQNYTVVPFTLSNGSNATVQLQTYIGSGGVAYTSYLTTNPDTDNPSGKGIWQSYLKLWKVD